MGPDAPVTERVHIIPLGFEYARLREPIFDWKADRVVAVEYSEADATIPYLDDLLQELEDDHRIALERRSCDIFDLYDALGIIAEAATEYEHHNVYVNISAGSKITAVAGVLACMLTGASPIYARPDYGPDADRIPDEPLHESVADIVELPTYPIDRPDDVLVAVLAHLEHAATGDGRYRGVSKQALIDFAKNEEFQFIVDSETESEKGYYRLLERHVVSPLRQSGYVQVEQVGRKKYVSLTQAGRNALEAFQYVLD